MDLLKQAECLQIDCLDHGFVRLVDTMPRVVQEGQTADSAIVQAARVSMGAGVKNVRDDISLIRYLMRHKHTTPFEMVEFKFHQKMPLFVARQQIRHRTASVNEISMRYSEFDGDFYVPDADDIKVQSQSNKQGSEIDIEHLYEIYNIPDVFEKHAHDSLEKYKELIEDGVAREQARMVLPVNMYTEWYWKIDLKNLLHFLALRTDSHAQKEIRVYADAMLELITPFVPETIKAWNDYSDLRQGMSLTKHDIEQIATCLKNESDGIHSRFSTEREYHEFLEKCKKLGIKGENK